MNLFDPVRIGTLEAKNHSALTTRMLPCVWLAWWIPL